MSDRLHEQVTDDIREQAENMIASMAFYFPAIAKDYRVAGTRLSIRAMPLSGADTRLVDVVRAGRLIRVRAGKIDAIIHAERMIKEMIA